MDLVELEQGRLVEFLSRAFDAMREGGDRSKLPAFREAFKTLSGTIRDAISGLSTRHQLTEEAYDRLNNLLNLQHSLESANDVVGDLGEDFQALEQSEFGGRFVVSAIEGLDTILLTRIDVAQERSEEDGGLLEMMTSEDGNGISSVRSSYLKEESALDPEARMKLLGAANRCERLIWLFGKMGQTYMTLKAVAA